MKTAPTNGDTCYFSNEQLSGWRLSRVLHRKADKTLPENCGNFVEAPTILDEGVDDDSDDDPLVGVIGDMLAMRDEEVPSGLSLQPGDITGDPIFSEMKKGAEDLLAELAA